jgi:hypothetical protein
MQALSQLSYGPREALSYQLSAISQSPSSTLAINSYLSPQRGTGTSRNRQPIPLTAES